MLRKQAVAFGIILLIVVATCTPSPDKDKDKESGKKTEKNADGCIWKGTSPFCDGGCNVVGHIVKETSKTGDGAECLTGNKVLCCPGLEQQKN